MNWVQKVMQSYWPEKLLAFFTLGVSFINLFSAIIPPFRERLAIIDLVIPFEVRTGTRFATLVAGFALMLLASGIFRRKQTAWFITVVILAISAVFHLIKGLDYEEFSISVILIILLVIFRNHFQARSDRPTIKRGFTILAIAISFVLLYGVLGFYLLDKHFSLKYTLFGATWETIKMAVFLAQPTIMPVSRYGKYFVDSFYLIGIGTIGFSLLALLSPVVIRLPLESADRKRAQEIIEKYGKTVLARFCLFTDKQYFFSQGGSVIAYGYNNRTAVVLGDPIGPPEDASSIIQEFYKFCRQNDWLPTFYQTLPDYLEFYSAIGFRKLKIGEEAILNLGTFTLEGGAKKSLRTSVNKLTKLGFNTYISNPPHIKGLLEQLKPISDEWLAERKTKEMKFSLGLFNNEYLNTTPIIVVEDPERKPVAFANLVIEYTNPELAVDLMRHKNNAPSGTMDYLFVSMIQYAIEKGYKTFNLGLSGMAGVGEQPSDPGIEKAIHFIYSTVNFSYNFKGLHSFKEKFSPEWSPRYLIFPALTNLPAISIGLFRVD
jgi:phosphatidylglycerol lysyltransferase